jgi:hypothetical protein
MLLLTVLEVLWRQKSWKLPQWSLLPTRRALQVKSKVYNSLIAPEERKKSRKETKKKPSKKKASKKKAVELDDSDQSEAMEVNEVLMDEEGPQEEDLEGSDIGYESEELAGLLGATSKKDVAKSKPVPDVSAFLTRALEDAPVLSASPIKPVSGELKMALRGTAQEMKGKATLLFTADLSDAIEKAVIPGPLGKGKSPVESIAVNFAAVTNRPFRWFCLCF